VATRALAALALVAIVTPAFAQWELVAEKSSLEFISVKKGTVAERHQLASLSGSIDERGLVQVSINLDSVETHIPIRNERVREMLFETGSFPFAEVHSQVDTTLIENIASGGARSIEIPITLALHGQKKDLSAPVVVAAADYGEVLVVTSSPILINAADFGLEKGVKLLQEVAGLSSISTVVPVSFQLHFQPVK